MESSSTKGKMGLGNIRNWLFLLLVYICGKCFSHKYTVDLLNLLCIRWGFLSRAGLWDKSHLMRQIEKYVLFFEVHISFITGLWFTSVTEIKIYILSVLNNDSLNSFSSYSSYRYADIYTSRVSNFLHYTPFMYFPSQEQVTTKHQSLNC